MASPLDVFFKMGEKATGGNPVRKAQYDYYLYWIVFISFACIAITYYYNFFFKNAPLSTMIWGVVITIFCWFNYFALGAFRAMYENMKKMTSAQEVIKKASVTMDIEDVNSMLSEFKK